MGKLNNRTILNFTLVAFLIFFIGLYKVMLSLNTAELCASLQATQLSHSSENTDQRYRNVVTLEQQHRHEIEMLKDQIRELQTLIHLKRTNQTAPTWSAKMSAQCLKEISFENLVHKTEALKGRSYTSERHVPTYTRFDMWHQYYSHSGFGEKVIDKLNGLQRVHVDQVIDEAVLFLNASDWRRDHFIEGLYQNSDTIGTHYELHFANDKGHKTRVALFRPQAPSIPLYHKRMKGGDKFNIIVPLLGRSDAFRIFLNNIDKLLEANYKIHLTIVYFGDSIDELLLVFQPFILKHSYRLHHIEHVKDRNFSRGYALDRGIRSWRIKADPIVFLCDVDVIFNADFIDRCQTYPEKGERVYYPIVFSLYNPKVVELYFDQKFTSISSRLKVTPEHGFWRDFGYGMTCLYRSDYLKSGGFDLDLKGWGEEDVLLFRAFAQSNMTVIRAPDPEIFHLWHHKSCDPQLSDEHYRDCIKSKTFNEGSHTQLGYLVLKDEIKQRRDRWDHL